MPNVIVIRITTSVFAIFVHFYHMIGHLFMSNGRGKVACELGAVQLVLSVHSCPINFAFKEGLCIFFFQS